MEEFLSRGGMWQLLEALRIGDVLLQEAPGSVDSPCSSVPSSAPLSDALRRMLLAGEKRLTVLEDGTGRVLGTITFEDLCRVFHRYCAGDSPFRCA